MLGCFIEGSSSDTRLWVRTVATGTCRPAMLQLGLQRLLEKISDFTLGRGATNVQRKPGNLARSAFRPQKFGSNLRTIAVREHDSVTGADQADDLRCGPLSIGPLFGNRSLFSRANQGVPANGKKHGLHKLRSVFDGGRAFPPDPRRARTPVLHLYVHQLLQLGESRQSDELTFHQFQHDRFLCMQRFSAC